MMIERINADAGGLSEAKTGSFEVKTGDINPDLILDELLKGDYETINELEPKRRAEAGDKVISENHEMDILEPQKSKEMVDDILERILHLEGDTGGLSEAKTGSFEVKTGDINPDLILDELLKGDCNDFAPEYDENGTKELCDDNGNPYIIDGKLQPNTTYELNGNIYTTDENGRIVSCEAKPVRSPENPRDSEAQRQAGGEDRRPNDQGGHIVGRDMNGDGGIGNLVAMDYKINQSDYKRMENDIKDALDEGKEVTTKTEITYSGDSERPDKITVTVTADGKDTVYEYDNNLDGSLDDEVYEKAPSGKAMLDEHPDAHVSSVKREYDENGNLVKTTAYITWTDEDGSNRRSPIIVPNN